MGDGERPTDERVIVAMGGARRRRAQRHASPAGERRAAAGCVALVGAGPGDPELLTLKAAKLVQRADAIVYDRLVAPAILALAPRAQKHYVGKARSRHAMPQEDINALIVQLARQGLRVVRLEEPWAKRRMLLCHTTQALEFTGVRALIEALTPG